GSDRGLARQRRKATGQHGCQHYDLLTRRCPRAMPAGAGLRHSPNERGLEAGNPGNISEDRPAAHLGSPAFRAHACRERHAGR
ncbi:MAG: hypothetical protein ACXU85_10950, partial [Xanthobacteraceae bacterium]